MTIFWPEPLPGKSSRMTPSAESTSAHSASSPPTMWKAVIWVAAICSTGGNLQIAPPPGDMQHLRSMLPSEVKAAGELAGTAVGGARDVHPGVARRHRRAPVLDARCAGGAGSRRPRRRRRARSTAASPAALGAGPRALAQLTPGNGIPAADTLRGSMALGALNGAIGDRLARDGSPLALDMRFRAFSGPATPKLAVFVHGLCETDEAWNMRKPSLRLPAARRSSATRRSTSATTPAFTSRTTAGGWPSCSTTWCATGPCRSRRSRSSVTRWAASWRGSACHHGRRLVRRGAPRLLPRRAPPRRAAREGRERARLCARPAAGDPPAGAARERPQRRDQGPPLRVLRRGGLVRLRSGRVPPRPLHRGPVPRGGGLLLRRRDAHAAAQLRWSETCSCSSRAPQATGASGGSRSRSTTACTWAAPTTSSSSTTRRSTTSWSVGCRGSQDPADRALGHFRRLGDEVHEMVCICCRPPKLTNKLLRTRSRRHLGCRERVRPAPAVLHAAPLVGVDPRDLQAAQQAPRPHGDPGAAVDAAVGGILARPPRAA